MNKNYSEYFEDATRTNGNDFLRLADGAPIELKELIIKCHQCGKIDSIPNDWIYQQIYWALEEFEQGNMDLEDFDPEPSVYPHDLIEWLENSFAIEYCQFVLDELGPYDEFMQIIRIAQAECLRDIYRVVAEFVKDNPIEESEDE